MTVLKPNVPIQVSTHSAAFHPPALPVSPSSSSDEHLETINLGSRQNSVNRTNSNVVSSVAYSESDSTRVASVTTSNPKRSSATVTRRPSDGVAVALSIAAGQRSPGLWDRLKDHNLRHGGLPTLLQILEGKSCTPLSRQDFYAFVRDYGKGDQETINFWLDCKQHAVTHQSYLEGLPKEGSLRFLGSTRSSSSTRTGRERTEHCRGDSMVVDFGSAAELPGFSTFGRMSKNDSSRLFRRQSLNERPVPVPSHGNGTPYKNEACLPQDIQLETIVPRDEDFATFEKLRGSALRIYQTYLCEGNQKRLEFYDPIRRDMAAALGVHEDYSSNAFELAQGYAYRRLNALYYTPFVRRAKRSNLTYKHAVVRLVLGILLLVTSFALPLTYIFLEYQPSTIRLFAIPFSWTGWLNLWIAFDQFEPLAALFGKAEIAFMKFRDIEDPYILSVHIRRSIKIFLFTFLLTIFSMGLLYGIPGHRLSYN